MSSRDLGLFADRAQLISNPYPPLFPMEEIMTPQDIQASFDARGHAVVELRRLVEENEGSETPAEVRQQIDSIHADISALDERIRSGLDHLEKEERANKAMDEFRQYGDLTAAPDSVRDDSGKVDDNTMFAKLCSGEVRSFESLPSEQRDLTKGSATAGGNIVDSTMYDRIWEKLEEESMVIAAGATVIRTASGEDLLVPKVTTSTTVSAITAEAGAISEADPVFGQVTLGAFKYSGLTQVSQELLSDSLFNVAGFVADQGGRAVARGFGADLSNGSGSSKPKGIAQAATSFGTSASATTITAANVFEIWATMPQPYKNSETKWIMSPEAEKTIRLLQDGNNQYIWQPGLQNGTPSNLLGYEVFVDGNLDAVTSGKRALVFAHMPSYAVRIAGGLQVDRSDDYAFANGLATFRFQIRGDGDGIDSNGIGCLTQA